MKLLEPYKLGNLELKNRVVMEPMCTYSAYNHDGVATDFHLAHYTSRAIGNVGLIIVEATGVSPEGRISDRCLGLYNDTQMEAMKRIVESVHYNGGKIGIQLNHAGRKCGAIDGVNTIYGPSAIAYSKDYRNPVSLDESRIESVIEDFKSAAIRANKAGFDALEIHGAHGYLISQFMSPYSNQRQDKYKDGALFAKRVVEAVRSVWPIDKPLLFRISATDFEDNGLNVQESIRILSSFIDCIDIINVSSGGITPTPPPTVYPGYQIGYAKDIKTALKKPVIGCGLLGSTELASYLVESNTVDMIGLARPLLRNSHWVIEAALTRRKTNWVPIQYERGFK